MQHTTDPTPFGITRLLQSLHNINLLYIKKQTSFYQYFLSPIIHITAAHAYVPLISVIDYLLAFLFQPGNVTPIDDVSQIYKIATCAHARVI